MSRVLTNFSIHEYKSLVSEFLEAGYDFANFGDASDRVKSKSRTVVFRHDIDFDVNCAERIARVEAQLGVSSTYFFLLRTSFYNIFGSSETEQIKSILALGHHIGLHFDSRSYPDGTSVEEMAENMTKEAQILSSWFKVDVKAVSFHRPSQHDLSVTNFSGNLINAYSPQFCESMQYVADSAGSWKYGHPTSHLSFTNGLPMQVLTHPIWWAGESCDPLAVLNEYRIEKDEKLGLDIAKNCRVYRVGKYENVTNEH